jgi:3-oxoacyl-ACP reductase-like protein
VCEGARKLAAYVGEMATGGPPPTAVNIDKVQEDVLKLWDVVNSQRMVVEAALTVVPFNQGSKQDVDALIHYIYSTLNLHLDYVLPSAAIPENGREVDGIDIGDKSELAHRTACQSASLARCHKTEGQS